MIAALLPLLLSAAPLLQPPTVSDDACLLDADGHLRCIDLQDHCVSAPPPDAFRSFGTSEGSSGCGLRTDGRVVCWGTFAPAKVPVDLGPVAQLSVGKPHACALRKDGTLRCWGSAYQGSLEAPKGTFTSVSVGHSVSCAVRADGALACWGSQADAHLAPPKGAFKHVAVGLQAACAIDVKGQLSCWGDLPKAPAGRFTSVSVGQFQACAVRDDGGGLCFGPSGVATPLGPVGTGFSEVGTRCGRLKTGALVCWSRKEPAVLQVDDGLTRTADASGACAPIAAKGATGPLPPRRPWVDLAMKQVHAGTLDTESGRDQVKKEDLPHFANEYRALKTWREKGLLINLLCDSHDPVLADMMWDALDVPDCTQETPCKFADGWEVRATVLSYLDGDFARFTTYLDDAALTKKTIARRLTERAARR